MREDIKKRREKYNIETQAQAIFGGKDMIIERKSGMDIAAYRYMRAIQKRALKMLFRRPPNPRIQALMRPAQPSEFLIKEVNKRRALKAGYLEEIKPVETLTTNFFLRIFEYIRRIFGQSYAVSGAI